MPAEPNRTNNYPPEFKEQALAKVRARGARTVESVADELNMSVGTLRTWIRDARRAAKSSAPVAFPSGGPVSEWSPAQRLQALNESFTLSGQALSAWCRERGLFEHQLRQWRESFCAPVAAAPKAALRDLQLKHEQLQRELRRKEKALAEAAALLVLQKKFQALFGDEDK
jgi:transposase-like protein